MRGRQLVALAITAVLAFGVGAGLATLFASDARSGLQSKADDSSVVLQDSRYAWNSQLLFLRSVEPAREATSGVYLATISPGASGTITFVADWESTDGLWSGPVHGTQGVIRNLSSYRQPLVLAPLATVFVQRPIGSNYPNATGPQIAVTPDFFRALSGNDAAGRALRQAHWWVTVGTSDQCEQLCEAPAF